MTDIPQERTEGGAVSDIPQDVMAAAMRALMVPEHDMVDSVSLAILAEREAERQRCADLLKDPHAVLVNWLRGGINADSIVAEISDRHQMIAREYAASFENGLCHYGQADKDAGRGRQEGHIKAGYDIAAAIRTPSTPKATT